MFRFNARADGQVKVLDMDMSALHESVLGPKYGFGAPTVAAKHMQLDGTLELVHDHETDGRGLDLERSRKVLDYVQRVWRRPVDAAHRGPARRRAAPHVFLSASGGSSSQASSCWDVTIDTGSLAGNESASASSSWSSIC